MTEEVGEDNVKDNIEDTASQKLTGAGYKRSTNMEDVTGTKEPSCALHPLDEEIERKKGCEYLLLVFVVFCINHIQYRIWSVLNIFRGYHRQPLYCFHFDFRYVMLI